jgi:hypothetical protein
VLQLPTFQFDADSGPDPAFYFDADPNSDPTFHFVRIRIRHLKMMRIRQPKMMLIRIRFRTVALARRSTVLVVAVNAHLCTDMRESSNESEEIGK